MAANNNIKIRLKSFDHKCLDQVAKSIVDAVRLAGGRVTGPVPMPRKWDKYTVLRSPHVNKKSREQFEMRKYTVLMFVDSADPLQNVQLPAGVDVELKAM